MVAYCILLHTLDIIIKFHVFKRRIFIFSNDATTWTSEKWSFISVDVIWILTQHDAFFKRAENAPCASKILIKLIHISCNRWCWWSSWWNTSNVLTTIYVAEKVDYDDAVSHDGLFNCTAYSIQSNDCHREINMCRTSVHHHVS